MESRDTEGNVIDPSPAQQREKDAVMTHLERLQNLLRELFQYDVADLDFGIYRLLQMRRDEVESFIQEQLPKQVDVAFREVTSGKTADLDRELSKLADRIRHEVADDAINGNGEPSLEYGKVKLVQEYAMLRDRKTSVAVAEAQRAEVFNHLYNFFSRYYEDGDFIPRRRYGAHETYAVPYNGEEVFFHWANKDQHYVKTGEAFKDYAFTVSTVGGDFRVRFSLTEASVPKDNQKGDRRFFFLQPDGARYDNAARQWMLPFEYRLPTEDEISQHGKDAKAQAAILESALDSALAAVPDEMLRAALAKSSNGEVEAPLLLKRLCHFCRRKTSDFFVHKDLRGFLTRELEFYLKDQVLHLDDLEGEVKDKLRVIRVVRRLAEQIIGFVSQIEEAQKRLFEKKKFVLKTDYLIPLQHVPRSFWPGVLANKAQQTQWQEWFALQPKKDLFNKAGDVNDAFLEQHPTLVGNTAHFDPEFTQRLLESLPFNDLDEATDGLLVYSENYQALRLLTERYREQVKCIHIDPPYNTETSGFLYKNAYQHSTWLTMMENRIGISLVLLSREGSFLCHIDENEYERLRLLFEESSIPNAGTVVWDKRNPMNAGRGIATQHEYIIWRSRQETPIYLRNDSILAMLRAAEEIIKKHGSVSEKPQKEYAAWVDGNSELTGGERAYRFLDEQGRIYQSVSLRAPEPRTDPKFFIPLKHPVTKSPCPIPPNGFSRTPETLQAMIERGEIIFGIDETVQPRQKMFLTKESRRQISSLIQDARKGKADASPLGLDFPYCHPVSLYRELIGATAQSLSDIILDFFAGSGTTAHACVYLNREDGRRRRFILVEMGEYFSTVLLSRIAKVMYTPEWKDGKPVRPATPEEAERTPRLVKVLRLESYEDALHNLAATGEGKLNDVRAKAVKELAGDDKYRLRYLVRLPLEASDTMLNVAKLAHPFDYTLEVLTEDGPQEQPVDLIETFNYLLGLRVQRYETWVNDNDQCSVGPCARQTHAAHTATKQTPTRGCTTGHGGRVYRVVKATDREQRLRILVVWRDMTDLNPKVERAFLEGKVAESGQAFDRLLINGDTAAKGFESLDGLFKRLMEEGEAA